MKVSIKLLIVGFLFASSGLLHAANTITNKTGQTVAIKVLYSGGIANSTIEPKSIDNNVVYTIPSSIARKNSSVITSIAFALPSCSLVSCQNNLSISANTSYNLVLASDNKTLQLVAV